MNWIRNIVWKIYVWFVLFIIGKTPVVANVQINADYGGFKQNHRTGFIMAGVNVHGSCDMSKRFSVETK